MLLAGAAAFGNWKSHAQPPGTAGSGASATIDTFAGGGVADGGPAISASLAPYDVAIDGAGALYVVDNGGQYNTNECRIRKISGGIITTVAGNGYCGYAGDGGAATSASFRRPLSVAVAGTGNLYVVDNGLTYGNNDCRVRKVSAGMMTTVAGNNDCGNSGDGGAATNSSLNPVSVAVDGAENLYIADHSGCRIRKVSGGIITTVAGNGTCGYSGDGGPAVSASLSSLAAVTLDLAGNMYVAEAGSSCRIRKVSMGIISTVAGNGTCSFAGDGGPATNASLYRPSGVAVDASGSTYISEMGDEFHNCRVRRVSGGVITTIAGSGDCFGPTIEGEPANGGTVSRPRGLVVDGSGAVYVATEGRCRVRRVAGGIITTVAGNGQCTFSGDGPATNASLFTPADLAFDDDGNAYIAEDWNCRVRKVTNGTILTVAGTFLPDYGSCATCCNAGQATNTPLYHPISVLADGSGDFYFGDYSCSVQKVESGILTTVVGSPYHCGWGGDGEAATEARIGLAYGLASDASGNLYVAGDCRVRKVSAGIITTVVGDGSCSYSPNDEGAPGEDAGIDPRGIAVDASGELYIADFANCRVRRVSGGTITTVAGDGNCTYGGDDGPGTSASLWNPSDVALDSNGALYIADRYNYRIRKLVGGTITTVAGNGNFGYSEDGLPATSATLNYLSGIAVDDDDNLYFTDGTRVRIVYSAVYQQIADMYAPLLLLSGGDYEPEEVGIMTADSTGVAQATLRNSSGAALLDQDTLLGDLCTHSDSDNYLDIDGLAPQSDVKMYAHTYSMIRDAFTDTAYARVVKDANDNGKVAAIQYWFFYFFDDWNNKHEGDWEQITLSFEPSASATDILSGSIEPKRAGYSQHTGGKKREWQDVETDPGVHPLVYVAAGSHANYFRAGTFRWGQWEDNATGNRLIAPAISLVPPTPPSSCGATADWLRYAGLWGQDVSLFRWPAGDGPNSPPTGRGHEAAWNNPTSWLNGLRSDTGYFGWPDCILPVDTFCRRSPSPPQQVTIGQNLQKIFTVIEAARSKFHIH